MNSRLFFLLILTTFLGAACRNTTTTKTDTKDVVVVSPKLDFKQFEGTYTGDFGGTGDIRIVLRHVTGVNAVGYNLHKGLQRNMSGKMTEEGNTYTFDLQEPGDNPFDGLFHFTIDPKTNSLTGTWNPLNNSNLAPKRFQLSKVMTVASKSPDDEFNYMQVMYDSTGEFHFEPNGLCIYRYYTDQNDTTATRQYEEVKGNWKKDATYYQIDWQKNDLFPARSRFKIMPYPEMDTQYYYLEGEGRKLEPQLAG